MNSPDFNKTRKYLDDISTKELERKGPDYSPDSDRLGNFKEVAAFLGVSPKIVWGVYMLKHLFAIRKWAQGGTLTSEGLEGRFVDLRNYIDLGYAISAEEITETKRHPCDAPTSYVTLPECRMEFGPGKCDITEATRILGGPVANALWNNRTKDGTVLPVGKSSQVDFQYIAPKATKKDIKKILNYIGKLQNENPRDRSRSASHGLCRGRRKQKGSKRRGK